MKIYAILALAVTYMIWSGFLISARAAVTGSLGPIELGLIRFVTSAVFFIPILWRYDAVPPGTKFYDIGLIGLTGGLLAFGCITLGLGYAPVADSAIFAPSLLPLFVVGLAYVFLGERIGPVRSFGILMIVIGAGVVGGWEALNSDVPDVWRGHIFFMSGAFFWAVYTIRFRRVGISPAAAAMMICCWTALAYGAMALYTGVDFSSVSSGMLLWQIFMQGVLAGGIALVTYAYAVKELGPSVSAAFAASVPVMTALGGKFFLDEDLSGVKIIGIIVVSLGVLLASGVLSRYFHRAPSEA